VEDYYYSWRQVTGSEAMKYWVNESEMNNCSLHGDLLNFGHQLFVIVSLSVFSVHPCVHTRIV